MPPCRRRGFAVAAGVQRVSGIIVDITATAASSLQRQARGLQTSVAAFKLS